MNLNAPFVVVKKKINDLLALRPFHISFFVDKLIYKGGFEVFLWCLLEFCQLFLNDIRFCLKAKAGFAEAHWKHV